MPRQDAGVVDEARLLVEVDRHPALAAGEQIERVDPRQRPRPRDQRGEEQPARAAPPRRGAHARFGELPCARFGLHQRAGAEDGAALVGDEQDDPAALDDRLARVGEDVAVMRLSAIHAALIASNPGASASV